MRECYPEKKKGYASLFFPLSSLSAMLPSALSRLVSMLVSRPAGGVAGLSRRCREAWRGGVGGVGVSAHRAGARGGAGLAAAGRRVATGAADCRAAGLVSCRL